MLLAGIISNQTAATPFISSWKTDNAGTSSSTQITIPTSSTGTYNCTVDWGDGNTNTITTWNDAAWTHTYSVAGTYTVKFYGTFNGIVFNNGGDRLKLLSITQWGTNFRVGTTQGTYFYGCANLVLSSVADKLNLSGTTVLDSMFRGCTSITTIPFLSTWDVSAVTSFNSMFRDATSFNSSTNGWTFSTSMSSTALVSMFMNCAAYNQSMASWSLPTTGNTFSMANFLYGCTVFNSSVAFNTTNVTSMANFFLNCSAFNQTVSFTTANVTSMAGMFQGCNVFNSTLSLSSTANVTTMANMFLGALAFNQSSVSSFNTAKVTSFANMFLNAVAFNQSVASWSIAALTNASSMFTGSAFNITNYNLLLNNTTGWPSQATIQSGVTFSAGSAHYSSGAPTTGRAVLTGTYTWTITDGGTP